MLSTETIQTLIADFQERWVPQGIPRDLQVDLLPGKVASIYGPRRAGKTYLLYQIAAAAAAAGLLQRDVLYVNFEDERILPAVASDLGRIVEAFVAGRTAGASAVPLVLLDEVQNVTDWPVVLRRLADSGDLRLAITGSSSRLLSRELSTRLRGRALSTELLPFSFREAARARGIDVTSQSTRTRARLDALLQEYVTWGGFPEIWTRIDGERLRRKLLQDYFEMTFFRDIVDRHGVTNTAALRRLLKYLAVNAGAPFSVSGFYKLTRAMGLSVGKDSLYRYLEHAEDALLFFPVSLHSRSVKQQVVNPRKVYCVDTGLRNAVVPPGRPDRGRMLEHVVYLELRRRGYEVTYWRDRDSGAECDFVASRDDEAQLVVQVCADVSDPSVLAREIRGLLAASERLPSARPMLLVADVATHPIPAPVERVHLPRWLVSPAAPT